jgi:hypothetical protein
VAETTGTAMAFIAADVDRTLQGWDANVAPTRHRSKATAARRSHVLDLQSCQTGKAP